MNGAAVYAAGTTHKHTGNLSNKGMNGVCTVGVHRTTAADTVPTFLLPSYDCHPQHQDGGQLHALSCSRDDKKIGSHSQVRAKCLIPRPLLREGPGTAPGDECQDFPPRTAHNPTQAHTLIYCTPYSYDRTSTSGTVLNRCSTYAAMKLRAAHQLAQVLGLGQARPHSVGVAITNSVSISVSVSVVAGRCGGGGVGGAWRRGLGTEFAVLAVARAGGCGLAADRALAVAAVAQGVVAGLAVLGADGAVLRVTPAGAGALAVATEGARAAGAAVGAAAAAAEAALASGIVADAVVVAGGAGAAVLRTGATALAGCSSRAKMDRWKGPAIVVSVYLRVMERHSRQTRSIKGK